MIPGAPGGPVPVVVHLSGSRRGLTERLGGDRLRIGSAPEADVLLPAEGEPPLAPHEATLTRDGESYRLAVAPGREVWVNGEPAAERVLDTGDVLEFGPGGPVLRYRLYPAGSPAYKSLPEAFSDCADCARYATDSRLGRAKVLLSRLPQEIATQTSRRLRGGLFLVFVLLVVLTALLTVHSFRLERRLSEEIQRGRDLAELVAELEQGAVSRTDLDAVRAALEPQLTAAAQRLEALEGLAGAGQRVIAEAARSVVFLQGSYGFVEEASGRPLRFAGLGPGGQPLVGPRGEPRLGVEGDGPEIEAFFTGTAFVATAEGLLLTNRHVARPWEFDAAAQQLLGRGFRPAVRRLLGFLPGVAEPFDLAYVSGSDEADVAVLRCERVTAEVRPLPLAAEVPAAGDEVIVLGYPTGIRALLARADPAFVAGLAGEAGIDFWGVARRLAEAGQIGPLATRGIVGQVTPAAVVYDAETTSGGSGGPVLTLAGEVVAVNAAILPEFGGSNLGVPAAFARPLLAAAEPAAAAPAP